MAESLLCWKFDNKQHFFLSYDQKEWFEYENDDLIASYETVDLNDTKTEAIIYQSDLQVYYKLTAQHLSFSFRLNGDYEIKTNGTWLIDSQHSKKSKLLQLVQYLIKEKKRTETLFKSILESEITTPHLDGPFDKKKVLYLDYTASGRSLKFIEDHINNHVLPNYSNTHSDGNFCAETTSECRDRARENIKKSLNAKSGLDELIFVGTGSTSAIHKLIGVLNIPKNMKPIVIVSPYEHHSNLLPWREMGSEIIYASDSDDSSIDLEDLEARLASFNNEKRLKIGSFTAASNVTGILVDVDKISSLLHKYGFLAFWDYSTAAPYLKIDMNPNTNDLNTYKDAVFFSGHKFLGGPQTPGILVAKKSLFRNKVPHNPGGGTVLMVSPNEHVYDPINENREEGGTPGIVESIRLGLVFKFKDQLNPIIIEYKEHIISKKAIDYFKKIPNMILLGNLKIKRLPIFSFLIRNKESGYYLHHNFVSRLLNDLFGIQSRSGCACAGPYGHYLLGIDEILSQQYVDAFIHRDSESYRSDYKLSELHILKPGFTRFNIPYFLDEKRIDFIFKCIKFVCEHGWKFLPLYEMNTETGTFKHVLSKRKVIHDPNIMDIINNNSNKQTNFNSQIDAVYIDDCLRKANEILEVLDKSYRYNEIKTNDQRSTFNRLNYLRWFLLPCEAHDVYLRTIVNNGKYSKIRPPFEPMGYDFKFGNLNFNLNTNVNFDADFDKCILCGEYHDEFVHHDFLSTDQAFLQVSALA